MEINALLPFYKAQFAERAQNKVLFYVWNLLVLFSSSAVICACSMLLATGTSYNYIAPLYLRSPLILLLNYLPILILQALLLCLLRSQWLAYFINSLFFIGASIGNFYKLKLRFEPFMFSDIHSIRAGLDVAGSYDLSPGRKVLFSVSVIVIGAALIFFLCKGRFSGRIRLVAALVLLCSCPFLWKYVYESDHVYRDVAVCKGFGDGFESIKLYVSKGFVYPFLHSIKVSFEKPDNYSDERALELLADYEDAEIPDDKRVNILAYQLESFAELSRIGINGVDEVFSVYRSLEAESYCGNVAVNIYGGGTENSEHCFITGYYKLPSLYKEIPSAAWYLRSQGYLTTGSHPNTGLFYNRLNINSYLGFEEYYYKDYYVEKFSMPDLSPNCDSIFFPETLRLFKEAVESGKNVFSFNVSYQNHSPYDAESYGMDKIYWNEADVSQEAKDCINRYLNSVVETQDCLRSTVEELRDYEYPVVLILYGDHKPSLCSSSAYSQLGLALSVMNEADFYDLYTTRYLIWANNAAKELIGHDICGEGPDISINYLMGLLFEQFGWKGSAYLQYTRNMRESLPVVTSLNYCIGENGFPFNPSEQEAAMLSDLAFVQYCLRKSLILD